MSLRLQMLQVARLAPNLLRESTEPVIEFVRSKQNADGGFADRAGRSDLYYTVFGIESLIALRQEVPCEAVASYLRGFGDGRELDYIHATCLARCWAAIGEAAPEGVRRVVSERLAAHRTDEGGYHADDAAGHGTAYGCFLAVGASQDIDAPLPEAVGIGRCLDGLATGDGGYANDPGLKLGSVPATAAAVTVRHQLGLEIDHRSADWMLGCCGEQGGFVAMPEAPMPDLLSTATALHALSAMGASIDAVRERCLDFVDTLWTGRGSFYANWAEEEGALDVEYTYYGLLALGHLSV